MCAWSVNQHLILKVKLPLKYMNIEVGDVVVFNELLGAGLKPYGIDYRFTAHFEPDPIGTIEQYYSMGGSDYYYGQFLNGQQIFPNMLVKKTVKAMDKIEIECIQLHNISNNYWPEVSTNVLGCTYKGLGDPYVNSLDGYWTRPGSYNSEANIDDGSCEWYGMFFGCADPESENFTDGYYLEGEDNQRVFSTDFTDSGLNTWEKAMSPISRTFTMSGQPYIHIPDICIEPVLEDAIPPSESAAGSLLVSRQIIDIADSEVPASQSTQDEFYYKELSQGLWSGIHIDGWAIGITNIKYFVEHSMFTNQNVTDIKLRITSAELLNESPGSADTGITEIQLNKHDDFVGVISGVTVDFDVMLGQDFLVSCIGEGLDDVYSYSDQLVKLKLLIIVESAGGSVNYYNDEVVINCHKGRQIGDINGDGGFNVVDIVALSGCILNNNCDTKEFPHIYDINQDGGYNVLDLITLAKCVLGGWCDELLQIFNLEDE